MTPPINLLIMFGVAIGGLSVLHYKDITAWYSKQPVRIKIPAIIVPAFILFVIMTTKEYIHMNWIDYAIAAFISAGFYVAWATVPLQFLMGL